MHQAGLHLFATVYDDSGLESAKSYIHDMGFTNQDVKISVFNNIISVISLIQLDNNFRAIK